jgi:hypothetical protein
LNFRFADKIQIPITIVSFHIVGKPAHLVNFTIIIASASTNDADHGTVCITKGDDIAFLEDHLCLAFHYSLGGRRRQVKGLSRGFRSENIDHIERVYLKTSSKVLWDGHSEPVNARLIGSLVYFGDDTDRFTVIFMADEIALIQFRHLVASRQ